AALPAMRESLACMAALDPAAALYCHAPVDSGPGLLRQNMAYFDTIEQRCRAALARGVPGKPDAAADVEALAGFPFTEALPAGAAAPTSRRWKASTGRATRPRSVRCWSTSRVMGDGVTG